jgi:hypothetical protein
LRLGNRVPHFRLRALGFGGELEVLAGERFLGAGELLRRLVAARRPAALLDTEGRDRNLPRSRRQDEIDGQHAVLPAALDDVAGLDEESVVLRLVLDFELVDIAGFVDGRLAAAS